VKTIGATGLATNAPAFCDALEAGHTVEITRNGAVIGVAWPVTTYIEAIEAAAAEGYEKGVRETEERIVGGLHRETLEKIERGLPEIPTDVADLIKAVEFDREDGSR
jgi:antitoxin (DNA-binding transcriptional repressor) of toxin-antitoxin stability system